MTKDDQIPAQKNIARAWKWHQTLATQTGPGSLGTQPGFCQLEEQSSSDVFWTIGSEPAAWQSWQARFSHMFSTGPLKKWGLVRSRKRIYSMWPQWEWEQRGSRTPQSPPQDPDGRLKLNREAGPRGNQAVSVKVQSRPPLTIIVWGPLSPARWSDKVSELCSTSLFSRWHQAFPFLGKFPSLGSIVSIIW